MPSSINDLLLPKDSPPTQDNQKKALYCLCITSQANRNSISFLATRVYIPNHGPIVKPLYTGAECKLLNALSFITAFQTQIALTKAPDTALPNLQKNFPLYITEKEGIALGLLGQKHGGT